MGISWIFFVVFVICLILRYHWSRRHLYLTSLKMTGPVGLPIIGSAHIFMFCKTDDLFHKIYNLVEKYDGLFRFWLGPKLLVVVKDPQHVEKILSSSKFSHKHDIYDLLRDLLGEGLITASGVKHRSDKKVIQPMFNLQFSVDCIKIIEKHVDICMEKLDKLVDKEFDIEHNLHLCLSDVIGETVLGYNLRSQQGENLKYIEAFTGVYKICFARLVKPWLHPDFIFYRCQVGKKCKNMCDTIYELMKKVANESHRRRLSKKCDDFIPVIDKISESGLSPVINYSYQLVTLYLASEDTITLITSAACLCFGMYPEYQKKVVEEISDVFGENPQQLLPEDITKLTYLDMCVKEIFRLFPIAPYILRKTLDDQQLDRWFLPKNCGITIPIYNLHKDPKYWENPDHFHPDHFLPEAERRRPSFVYLPFSAGPRGCIGKVFANIGVKVVLIKLLQRFEIEAQGKLPDVRFTMDISIRSQNGYRVKIKRRNV